MRESPFTNGVLFLTEVYLCILSEAPESPSPKSHRSCWCLVIWSLWVQHYRASQYAFWFNLLLLPDFVADPLANLLQTQTSEVHGLSYRESELQWKGSCLSHLCLSVFLTLFSPMTVTKTE